MQKLEAYEPPVMHAPNSLISRQVEPLREQSIHKTINNEDANTEKN